MTKHAEQFYDECKSKALSNEVIAKVKVTY